MSRPYFSFSFDQLEAEYRRAEDLNDQNLIKQVEHELEFRSTSKARKLKQKIASKRKSSEGNASSAEEKPSTTGRESTSGFSENNNSYTAGGAARKGGSSKIDFKPTEEQQIALDKFSSGGSLKINAYAGTGKTSTLQLLAASTNRRGQYIAFNRSIVSDAKKKFPSHVDCATSHSLAFKATPSSYKNNRNKCFGKISANQLVEILQLKQRQFDTRHALQPRSQGYLILSTIRRFAQSPDLEIRSTHVPRHGALTAAPISTIQAVEEFAVNEAKVIWARMKNEHDIIPLGHDGYLKLWALSKPQIAADYILLDEAQDTNPVVLDVLNNQSAQMIYVGDKHQQIYEWRGAINAMEAMDTDHTARLTQSFRFGPTIAAAATAVLKLLGERVPLTGNALVKSQIVESANTKTILARTNGSAMAAVIEVIDANKKPCLIGAKDELKQMLRGVLELKEGRPSDVPDFFGFENWQQVIEFANSAEGEHLQTFVNLVLVHGEKRLMWALNRTVDEGDCDVVISTAHKAKGCEWSSVRLMDDFLKSQPERKDSKQEGHDPAELRLFYVALTRAKEILALASAALAVVGGSAKRI